MIEKENEPSNLKLGKEALISHVRLYFPCRREATTPNAERGIEQPSFGLRWSWGRRRFEIWILHEEGATLGSFSDK